MGNLRLRGLRPISKCLDLCKIFEYIKTKWALSDALSVKQETSKILFKRKTNKL